ncbi:MAG: ribbon-helix-helix protein, CopG family [Phycisphaerae bacterium]|nr:ribbon-helix-helix protein, CopG family [Phycisphaerae bacterium]
MRTTLTIDSQVLAEFKRRSAETHQTLSRLIEDALR